MQNLNLSVLSLSLRKTLAFDYILDHKNMRRGHVSRQVSTSGAYREFLPVGRLFIEEISLRRMEGRVFSVHH